MDENRIAGTARNVGGKVQEGVGGMAGDAKLQAEGKINQALGSAQDLYGQVSEQVRETAGQAADVMQHKAKQAAEAVRDETASLEKTLRKSVDQRPLMTVAVALGTGWLIGRMLHR